MRHPHGFKHCIPALTILICFSACTGSPGRIRLEQQEESFSNFTQDVNTKIDMLWVIDNSPSMAPSQKKIRDGLRAFADRYMKPNWDMRVAVISQDTYLAHPSFAGFLNSVGATGSAQRYSRAAGYQSTYLNPGSASNPRRTTPFVTPSWWQTTSISAAGTVQGGGIKLRHAIPEYGGANAAQDVSVSNPSQYARLIPGRHDGPLATLCWTSNSNPFFFDITQCHVRDRQDEYSGTQGCVLGGTGSNDSAAQCVNTLMNNTVRSGKAIIETMPPEGVAPNAVWTEQLYEDFLVNVSGGVSGYPMEKFFSSVQQLITDNEGTSTRFFRPGSLRVIAIVSDEDDQSTIFPSSQITPDATYDNGAACPWKTVGTHTYRLQICPKPAQLLAVSAFKSQLDAHFRALDGTTDGDPNYFVVTIAPMTGQVLKDLHDEMGESGGSYGSVSSDFPTRLTEFTGLVGNGSLNLEITSADYTPLLESVGNVIVQKKAVFTLTRAPMSTEELSVRIKHANGTIDLVPPSDYTVEGKTITITNMELVLSLSSTDQVLISYEPKTVF